MANSSSIGSPPASQDERQPTEGPPDNKLPENSQENLNARLDHGIEETFPTSDPVSVHITAGPAPKPDRADQEVLSSSPDDPLDQTEQDPTEQLLDQVRDALQDVTDSVSGALGGAYDQGSRYVRQARDQYPEADRYIREGQQAVTRHVTENPLLALFMAGVAGYALAWLIHGRRHGQDNRVPGYGRTQQSYAPSHNRS
jgi:ElaB/YqjD/DUF883 family membrane-anchored ribosome-binding protein